MKLRRIVGAIFLAAALLGAVGGSTATAAPTHSATTQLDWW